MLITCTYFFSLVLLCFFFKLFARNNLLVYFITWCRVFFNWWEQKWYDVPITDWIVRFILLKLKAIGLYVAFLLRRICSNIFGLRCVQCLFRISVSLFTYFTFFVYLIYKLCFLFKSSLVCFFECLFLHLHSVLEVVVFLLDYFGALRLLVFSYFIFFFNGNFFSTSKVFSFFNILLVLWLLLRALFSVFSFLLFFFVRLVVVFIKRFWSIFFWAYVKRFYLLLFSVLYPIFSCWSFFYGAVFFWFHWCFSFNISFRNLFAMFFFLICFFFTICYFFFSPLWLFALLLGFLLVMIGFALLWIYFNIVIIQALELWLAENNIRGWKQVLIKVFISFIIFFVFMTVFYLLLFLFLYVASWA